MLPLPLLHQVDDHNRRHHPARVDLSLPLNIWLNTEKPSSQLIDPSIFCVKLWMAMESDPCIARRSRTETMESISQVHLASTRRGRLAHEGNIGTSPTFEKEIRILTSGFRNINITKSKAYRFFAFRVMQWPFIYRGTWSTSLRLTHWHRHIVVW